MRAAFLPLTTAQEEILIREQLGDALRGTPAHTISMLGELVGEIDTRRLTMAIQRTVHAAETLHVEVTPGATPVQRVIPAEERQALTVDVIDLRDDRHAEKTARAEIRADQAAPSGTATAPEFRHVLFLLPNRRVWWYQRYHHILIDGYGISLIIAATSALYSGAATEPPAWPLQSAVDADLSYCDSDAHEHDRRFWAEELYDAPEPPQILSAHARADLLPDGVSLLVSPELSERVQHIAAQNSVRPPTVVVAAMVAYLHRVTGVTDLTVSLPVTARRSATLRAVPSMASNILPLRVQIDPSESFDDVVARVHRSTTAMLRHSTYRGESLVRQLREDNPDRRVGGPGINVMLFPVPSFGPGVSLSLLDATTGTVNDLELLAFGTAAGDLARIDLRGPNGSAGDLQRHSQRFEHVMQNLVKHTDVALKDIPACTPKERELLLGEWRGPARRHAARTLPDLFTEQVRMRPEACALVAPTLDGRVAHLSYSDLSIHANQLARHLRQLGLQDEGVVAISLPRSAEMVVGLLAAMIAGGAFVPLDPQWPRDRRDQVLAQSGAKLILTVPESSEGIPVSLTDWAYGDYRSAPLHITVDGRQLAYIMFTSGSTGTPKGAMIRHDAICERLLWQRDEVLHFGPDDASLFKAPLSFDISVNEILLPLVAGGRLIVAEPGGERDPQYLLDLIGRERVTFVYLVSSMLDVLLQLDEHSSPSKLAGLKHVWCGGEVLTPALFQRFRSQLGTTLYHGYGPAEATIGVSHVIYRDDAERIATSIGRANPNTQLYVLNGQLEPVPIGMPGELYAAGNLLGRGYAGAPALTATRFVANPYDSTGTRLYRTGDLARWTPDGTLEFLGRTDNQVKLRGMRLELEDVEAALTEHPQVRHAAVLLRTTSAGVKYLAAYIVVAAALSEDDVLSWAAEKLPDYMVPSAVVVLDEFPLTPNGKLDRKALPEPYVGSGQPTGDAHSPEAQLISSAMSDILGVQVGPHDDFFRLGGDSIIAIQLVSRLRQADLTVRPRDIFQLRTPIAIASAAHHDTTKSGGPQEGTVTPTPLVARARELGGHVAGFSQSAVVQLPAGVSGTDIETALEKVISQHGALRAHLDRTTWNLVIPETRAPYALLSTAPEAATTDDLTAAATSRLNPDDGVMVQGVLAGERLILVIHHLVVDAVSWRVVLEDLACAVAGQPLTPSTTPLRRWTEAYTEHARTGGFAVEAGYWRDVVSAGRTRLGSRNLDASKDLVGTAGTRVLSTNATMTERLISDVPTAFRGTTADVLLTALSVALHRWRPGAHVLVDLERHGRSDSTISGAHLDLSRTVGWFTAIHPVLLPSGDAPASQLLKRVKETVRSVPGDGLGYGSLRYLTRELADTQPAQILLNYLGRVGAAHEPWTPVAMGATRDPRAPLAHVIEIDALVTPDTQLETRITYAPGVLSETDIDSFTDAWHAALGLVSGIAEDGGATPSDFPLVTLTQEDVDALATAVPVLEDVLPLTPTQEGIFFHSQLSDAEDPYVVQQIVDLEGPVDAELLRGAIETLVAQHEALRSSVHAVSGGRVVQAVTARTDVPYRYVDVTGHPAEYRRALLAEDKRPMAFHAAPLARFLLLRLDETHYQLVQSIHHIIADGWSIPVMLRDVLAAYGNPRDNRGVGRLRDYHRWLASQDRARALAAWASALDGVTEPPELPAPSSPAPSGSVAATVPIDVPAETAGRLRAVARERSLTLSTVIHGAWALTLGRLAGTGDVVIGSTVSGRDAAVTGIETMAALFINTVPARVRFTPIDTLSSVLTAFQQEQASLLEHQHAGLADIRREADLTGNLFETLVVFENYPLGDITITDPAGHIRVTDVRVEENPAYPVTLIVLPGDGLRLELRCDTGRVDANFAGYAAQSLVAVIDALAADPEMTVGALALGTAPTEAVGPQIDVPEQTLTELLDATAELGSVAVVSDEPRGRTVLTHRDLHARAHALAHALRDRGAGPESIVGVAIPRSADLMVALLAVLKTGAAYLPLDTSYPPDRLAFMVHDAAPVCVLVNRDTPVEMPGGLDVSVADGYPHTAVTDHTRPDNPAYVIYTSGSTGRPKGVVVSHRAIVNRLLWMQDEYKLTVRDRVVQKTPASFDVSVWEFFLPLVAGSALVFARPDGHRDPSYLADLMTREQVSVAHFVPTMLDAFLASIDSGTATRPALRRVVCSGEALPPNTANACARLLPDSQLDNLYGPTEAAVDVTCARAVQHAEHTVPIGTPVWNTTVQVLDDWLQPVPEGVAGELYLCGTQLARGYLKRPGLTAARFVANPHGGAGERMYRTGDRVRWMRSDTGRTLDYLGRFDDQVKLRGLRIELGEINTVLLERPDIAHAAVIVREDAPGVQQLVAYVVGFAGVTPDIAAARTAIAQALPEFMLPATFVVLDELPVSPSGKLDRRALPAPASTTVNPEDTSTAETSTAGTSHNTADRIARLASEVAGTEIGADDDFFALGGDSILAIRFVNLARQHGVSFSLRDVFDRRTPRALAELVGTEPSTAPAETVDEPLGEVIPLPIVNWLAQWDGGTDRFNQAVVLTTPSAVTEEHLRAALQRLVNHHDSLRQKLTRHAHGVWSLEVLPPGTVQVGIQTVEASSTDLRELITRESGKAAAALKPEAAVLLHAVYLDRGVQHEGRLVLVAHHLAVDAVSWQILLEDLAVTVQCPAAALPKPRTSLRTFARLVQDAAQNAQQLQELSRWRDITAPGAELVEGQDGYAAIGEARERVVTLEGEIAARLLHAGSVLAGADVTETLLAGLRVAVSRWAHAQRDVLIDVERHGRDAVGEADLSRTAGWFTTVTPLRLPASANPLDALATVKELLREMPSGGAGFGMLRYANARTAPILAQGARAQVLFNYLGREAVAAGAPWQPAPESDALSAAADADMAGPYRLVINALFEDSGAALRFKAHIGWSPAALSDTAATQLVDQWLAALTEIGDAAERHTGPARLTPSDVARTGLSQSEIDRLQDQHAIETIWPLSPLQEGLYFQARFATGQDVYTAQFTLDFGNRIDVDALRAALRELQRRNPSLRAGFASDGLSRPVQFITTECEVPVTVHDLSDELEAEARADDVLCADRALPFALSTAPLWRVLVLRLPGGTDRLAVNRQFMLWDGWSNGIVVSQLLALYTAARAGGGFGGVPAPRGSFARYLDWVAQRDVTAALDAWRAALAGLDAPSLVTDGTAAVTGLPLRLDATVSADATAALLAQARKYGVTLNALLNAALALTLSLETGRTDVVFGTTDAGRPTDVDGIDTVAGMFLNTVPVRASLRADESVSSLGQRLQTERLALREHDFVGLAEIQRVSGVQGPLFDVLFVLQNFVDEDQAAHLYASHGITGGDSTDHTHYPLTVVATPGRELALKFEYHPDVLAGERVARMLARFEAFLARFADGCDEPIAKLERPSVVPSPTAHTLPDATIADLLAVTAARQPEDVALVAGTQKLTYAEFDARINQCARLLLHHGAGPEKIVALGLPRTLDMVVALFGVLRTGAAYLPLELDHPVQRLRDILDDAQPAILLTTSSTELTNSFGVTLRHDDLTLETHAAHALSHTELGPFAPGTPGRLQHAAYVIYTSGSTGTPKGVITPYAGLTNMLFNHRDAIFAPVIEQAQRTLRIAHTVSFAFDMSWEELLWLVEGHQVHVCDEDLRRDAAALTSYLRDHRIDVINVTPTYAQHLLDWGLLDTAHGHIPPLVLLGGEAVPATVWQALRDCPGTLGYNLYGPTEYTINTLGAGTNESTTPTVGRPIWNTTVYVLDPWLRPVPDGIAGELYIRGCGLARGYAGRAALTADRFVASPFGEPGARMYRTGDLVRVRPDGMIDYLGRTDDQVKIRGHRVEPAEIDAVITRAPGVRNAAVVPVHGPGGTTRLVAYVITEADAPATTLEGLRPRLKAELPDYLVPSAFVGVESLPMTVNGKLDVRALPHPEFAGAADSRPPRTRTERALCELFADVLGLPEIPGIDDDFFDLGGHSLLATRVAGRVRAELGGELSLRDLFDAPTVAELAPRISLDGTRPALTRLARPAHLPLSPAQQRLWLIHQLQPHSLAYNFPIVVRLRGAVDPDAFTDALTAVAERHESLRTVFVESPGGQPAQVIVADAVPDVVVSRDVPESEVASLVLDAVAQPFDLSNDIPVRAALIECSGEWVLALVLHHIATDEWSDRPFLRDLVTAYQARLTTGTTTLPPLPVQYADYTLWQAAMLGDPADPESRAGRQLNYWADTLKDAPAEIQLPADQVRPATPSYTGGVVMRELSDAARQNLQTLAKSHSASLFIVLHAATAVLLKRLGAGDDIPLGAPVTGRADEALHELVGFFVNTVVLRTDVSGDPSFSDLVARIRARDLEAFANADVPFEWVAARVNPARSMAHNPLFHVMVAYHQQSAEPHFAGIPAEPVAAEEIAAKFDLVFNYTDTASGLQLRLEYSADLFSADAAALVADRTCALLDAVAQAPETPLSSVPLLLERERDRVVTEFNATTVPVERETLPRMFSRWVRQTPDAVAVTDETGSWTYGELDAWSASLADTFAAAGVEAEDVVALALPRSAGLVAAILAVQRLGAAYLPIDLAHPADRIAYMLDDAKISLLVRSPGARLEPPVGVPAIALSGANATSTRGYGPAAVDHAAYVIYTSGSTGTPKGVVVPHEGIASLVATATERMRLRTGSVVLQFASPGFDVAVFEVCMALGSGSRLQILPDDARVAGPALTDFLNERAVTHAILPPSLMAALPDDCVLPEGCTVLVGTEVVPPDLISRWARHLNLLVAYGVTEATVNNTLWQASPDWAEGNVPIGIPDPNEQIYILDEHLQPTPLGVEGDLYIAGHGLARGYLGKPGLTAARFVANPFTPGVRMYHSGDRARWRTDGTIDFAGRSDEQLKIRGFRIEPGEITAALASYPGVRQAAVHAFRAGTLGVGDGVRLAGYVTVDGDPDVDAEAVRAHVATVVPSYMVPATVVILDGTLPLTPNGKLDRKALPEPDWTALTGAELPRTETEHMLADAVAEVLALPRVGVFDNFFDLGGNSMAAMRLVSRIRAASGASLSLRDVFAEPTVAGIARTLRPCGGLPPVPAAGKAALPHRLAPAQALHWNDYAAGNRLGSHGLALYPASRVDADVLEAAIADVARRHTPLRTLFSGGVCVEGPLPRLEQADVSSSDPGPEVYRLAQREFNLSSEPPVRFTLVTAADGTQVLLLTMHYLAVDEWSVVVLLHELAAAYQARVRGDVPELPPLQTDYPAYAEWAWEVLGDPHDAQSRSARETEFWAGRLPAAQLDLGDRAGSVTRQAITIDADMRAQIDALARRTGTSLFAVIQAVFAGSLASISGTEPVMIGTLTAGRVDASLEGLAGGFAQVVPVVVAPTGDLAADARSVAEATLDAVEHSHSGWVAIAAAGGTRGGWPQVLAVHHQVAELDAVHDVFGPYLPIPVGTPPSELTLAIYESPPGEPVNLIMTGCSVLLSRLADAMSACLRGVGGHRG